MKNLSIVEPQIEKHYAYKKTCSLDWTSIVSVSNNFLRHFSIYIMKSQCILTTVDFGEKSFSEGDILTCIDGYSTDLNFESDH